MTLNQRIRHWNHRRIDRMRAWKLALARLLFSPLSRPHSSGEKDPILVLRLDGKVGDSVTVTGFLRELKRQHPRRKLIVATSQGTEGIYRNLPHLDRTLTAKKGLLPTLRLYLKLRRHRYYALINTSHILNPRVVFLTSLLKAQRKITFANPEYRIFTDHVPVDFRQDHITDRYAKILKLLGSEATDLRYELQLRSDVRSLMKYGADDLRKKAKYLVALNSFAGARLRNLNHRTTTAIVRRLLEYPDVKIISLANEGDHRILNTWIDQSYGGRWLNTPQFSSLEQNIALLEQCDLVITPDTAWVHIASALQKKLIAIYREDTNPDEINSVIWAPHQTEHEIVFAPGTPENPDDINNVDPEAVVQAAAKMLGLTK